MIGLNLDTVEYFVLLQVVNGVAAGTIVALLLWCERRWSTRPGSDRGEGR